MAARVALLAAWAVLLSACAVTREARFGQLGGDEPLLTLVVTTDRSLVERECAAVPSAWPRYGCMLSRPAVARDGARVRAVKVVRYADRLPSELTFEIDAHELCHAVAALQPIDDPCHVGNEGLLRSITGR